MIQRIGNVQNEPIQGIFLSPPPRHQVFALLVSDDAHWIGRRWCIRCKCRPEVQTSSSAAQTSAARQSLSIALPAGRQLHIPGLRSVEACGHKRHLPASHAPGSRRDQWRLEYVGERWSRAKGAKTQSFSERHYVNHTKSIRIF